MTGAGAPSCYLDKLVNLQKAVYMLLLLLLLLLNPSLEILPLQHLALSLAAFIEPLVHRRNVASLRLFYRYYFGKCPSELDTLTAFLYSRRRFTCYSNSLPNSPVTIPTCYAHVISFFFFFWFYFCTTVDSGFLWPQNAFL